MNPSRHTLWFWSQTCCALDALGLRPQLEGQGIASLSAFLETFGYRDTGDELDFPKKKLRARWLRMWPPRDDLPRVFISELKAGPARGRAWRWAGALLARLCGVQPACATGVACACSSKRGRGRQRAMALRTPGKEWGACRDTPCLCPATRMHAAGTWAPCYFKNTPAPLVAGRVVASGHASTVRV
jgi:hypothetical protein